MDKPALPKGTRDFGPLAMSRRQYIMDVIRDVFQRFGFAPLETPAMENLSVLMGKYGDEGDQLLFKVLNSGDFLKDVDPTLLNARNARALVPVIAEKGLRYDLTVPFARYVIMNRHEITLPFKRYQMQPVWRADRPQKGRYREFYQCDADVVGTNSLLCEMEIILMVKSVFRQLGIEAYTIRINHRDVLTGVASLVDAGNATGTLFTAIDKLDKVGVEGVRRELAGNGWSDRQLDRLFEILATTGTNVDKLDHLDSLSTDAGKKGIADLREILALLLAYGDSDEHVEVDLSLARGLSYYTGTIFEVRVDGVSVGSVSGGGRYDNLTQAFGSKEQLPGVGISFGLDRLYDVLDELARFPESPGMSTRVLICHIDAASLRYGLKVLSALRNAGIGAEIYPDEARLKKQLDYANKRSIPHAIVIGPDEIASRLLVFRDMALGRQEKKPLEAILEQLKA
ncbi:MAG TPA: histidine--tRNA ligase [Cyclobacteriaceae bacterium]